mgnify:CR=1 FL=1
MAACAWRESLADEAFRPAQGDAGPRPGGRSGVAVQTGIEAMTTLGRLLHAESRFRTLPLDDARMAEIGRRGLADVNPGLLMAEPGGKVVGMAIVMLGEYYFSPARGKRGQGENGVRVTFPSRRGAHGAAWSL